MRALFGQRELVDPETFAACQKRQVFIGFAPFRLGRAAFAEAALAGTAALVVTPPAAAGTALAIAATRATT
jgi:hypothetical protein